jgi:hypothetical protein
MFDISNYSSPGRWRKAPFEPWLKLAVNGSYEPGVDEIPMRSEKTSGVVRMSIEC